MAVATAKSSVGKKIKHLPFVQKMTSLVMKLEKISETMVSNIALTQLIVGEDFSTFFFFAVKASNLTYYLSKPTLPDL
jgi:hypothetical protein